METGPDSCQSLLEATVEEICATIARTPKVEPNPEKPASRRSGPHRLRQCS